MGNGGYRLTYQKECRWKIQSSTQKNIQGNYNT